MEILTSPRKWLKNLESIAMRYDELTHRYLYDTVELSDDELSEYDMLETLMDEYDDFEAECIIMFDYYGLSY